MGIFSKKNKKLEKTKRTDLELTEEELEKVKAGVPRGNRDWCPKVDVKPLEQGELTEEELDEVKAGVPIINEGR